MSDDDKIEDKIDKELEALVKAPERPLSEAPARPPGISGPAEASGVNYLAMNCVIPGLGSLMRGDKGMGAAQLSLAVIGLLMILTGYWLLGFVVGFGAYIWSVVSGFGFLKQKKPSW